MFFQIIHVPSLHNCYRYKQPKHSFLQGIQRYKTNRKGISKNSYLLQKGLLKNYDVILKKIYPRCNKGYTCGKFFKMPSPFSKHLFFMTKGVFRGSLKLVKIQIHLKANFDGKVTYNQIGRKSP